MMIFQTGLGSRSSVLKHLRDLEVEVHDRDGNKQRSLLVRVIGVEGVIAENRFFGLLSAIDLDQLLKGSITMVTLSRHNSGHLEVSPHYGSLNMSTEKMTVHLQGHRTLVDLKVNGGDDTLKLQVYEQREALIREREWRVRWDLKEALKIPANDVKALYIGAVQAVGKDAPTELIFETAMELSGR